MAVMKIERNLFMLENVQYDCCFNHVISPVLNICVLTIINFYFWCLIVSKFICLYESDFLFTINSIQMSSKMYSLYVPVTLKSPYRCTGVLILHILKEFFHGSAYIFECNWNWCYASPINRNIALKLHFEESINNLFCLLPNF